MNQQFNRKIVLPTGAAFYGTGFGAGGDIISELVFNTSMAGYQEIISDPSYTDQTVVMTYPLIGNYGVNPDDYECAKPSISGMIVRDYNDHPSNFRSVESLSEAMKRFGITGISGIDTRKLTRIIREQGTIPSLITDADRPEEECLDILSKASLRHDQVSRVSPREITTYRAEEERFRIAAIDCGMKENIVRSLNARNVTVIRLPYDTDAKAIESLNINGIFISNGPGDPEDAVPVIQTIRQLKGCYPIFGICLGHQIISLAMGAKTYKLKFGHRGGNHPVKNLMTGKIEITSQNHSYAVDKESLAGTGLEITHINLLDDTVEGIACDKERIFGVQYHPESAPGPNDSGYLFDRFIKLMEK
ncbi:MAG: glutamine-hydrolyzing carbamoyl-phosphate synthase small subunit [Lachnospiraceae bacterium]|nr:glutamine-hydrolyzing carbamoyl-phosphate synthase small subunit [Lachnospiraceae bacterium]